jgi:hypothetical protein
MHYSVGVATLMKFVRRASIRVLAQYHESQEETNRENHTTRPWCRPNPAPRGVEIPRTSETGWWRQGQQFAVLTSIAQDTDLRSFQVANVDELVAKLKNAGIKAVSTN